MMWKGVKEDRVSISEAYTFFTAKYGQQFPGKGHLDLLCPD